MWPDGTLYNMLDFFDYVSFYEPSPGLGPG